MSMLAKTISIAVDVHVRIVERWLAGKRVPPRRIRLKVALLAGGTLGVRPNGGGLAAVVKLRDGLIWRLNGEERDVVDAYYDDMNQ